MGNNGTFLISIVVGAVAGYWVYTDAKKRPMNATGWGIGTFLFCIVFLPLYLIMRKPPLTAGVQGLPPGAVVYTQPPPPPPPGMAPPPPAASAGPVHFCVQCGQKYEGTVKFCPSCGATQG